MIDQLLKSANGPLQDLLASAGGSRDSSDAVRESFLDVIQRQASSGDYSGIMEMFSGSETPADSPTVNHLKGAFGSGISEKLGIDSDKAMALASQALPLLLNFFNNRVNAAPRPNQEIAESVVNSMKKNDESGLGEVFSSIFGTSNDTDSFDLGDVIKFGSSLFKK